MRWLSREIPNISSLPRMRILCKLLLILFSFQFRISTVHLQYSPSRSSISWSDRTVLERNWTGSVLGHTINPVMCPGGVLTLWAVSSSLGSPDVSRSPSLSGSWWPPPSPRSSRGCASPTATGGPRWPLICGRTSAFSLQRRSPSLQNCIRFRVETKK